ncbi:GNAT family N-acetyltransferase [Ruania alba]|nr:GNAT family N-acetyltransferase [Ruania alba]
MHEGPVLNALETERLLLRPQRADDAAVYHQLWTERDPRVPAHRRISPEGHPSVAEVAATITDGRTPGLLGVERKDTGSVIGYCGLIAHGHGSPAEPELAYELLREAHGRGYATEAARAVVTWAGEAGYRRLWAGVRDWNLASRRVLLKLGFRETDEVERDDRHGNSLLTVRDLSGLP